LENRNEYKNYISLEERDIILYEKYKNCYFTILSDIILKDIKDEDLIRQAFLEYLQFISEEIINKDITIHLEFIKKAKENNLLLPKSQEKEEFIETFIRHRYMEI
jgi:hypothetical protein